jgi:hypothetical protein
LLVALGRRFLLPAFVGAYLSNLAVYRMLGSEGAATDWQSIGVLFGIILAGLLVAWPVFALIRRQGLAAPVLTLLTLVLGTATGALAAYLIALRLVPDTAGDYVHFGLAVGPVAALFWLILNFDILRAAPARQIGD